MDGQRGHWYVPQKGMYRVLEQLKDFREMGWLGKE
jgi:hypothetical protein